jgi:catechol 2,3-dioxygenase-like lactoylglutathione lyase family enzyme
MRIGLSGIMVDNQDKALAFYTGILGFTVKHDMPMGQHRWLTVISPEGAAGVEPDGPVRGRHSRRRLPDRRHP